MQTACVMVKRFCRNEEGQDLLEYGMLAALVAVFAIGAVTTLGNMVVSAFWSAIAAANI